MKKEQQSGSIPKTSGALPGSGGGSFRGAGQSRSGGGSFSGSRPFGRGSTTIGFAGADSEAGDTVGVYAGPKISIAGGASSTGGGHISLTVPTMMGRSPSIASVLAAPGGAGQQSIMSIGHFALVPTMSHSSRLDAPILQYLPWLKSISSFLQQG